MSATALPEGQRLPEISARSFEHPADRAATAALGRIPMLDVVVRKLIELGYEQQLRQNLGAGALKLGSSQLGDAPRGAPRRPRPGGGPRARRPRPLPDRARDPPRARPRTGRGPRRPAVVQARPRRVRRARRRAGPA